MSVSAASKNELREVLSETDDYPVDEETLATVAHFLDKLHPSQQQQQQQTTPSNATAGTVASSSNKKSEKENYSSTTMYESADTHSSTQPADATAAAHGNDDDLLAASDDDDLFDTDSMNALYPETLNAIREYIDSMAEQHQEKKKNAAIPNSASLRSFDSIEAIRSKSSLEEKYKNNDNIASLLEEPHCASMDTIEAMRSMSEEEEQPPGEVISRHVLDSIGDFIDSTVMMKHKLPQPQAESLDKWGDNLNDGTLATHLTASNDTLSRGTSRGDEGDQFDPNTLQSIGDFIDTAVSAEEKKESWDDPRRERGVKELVQELEKKGKVMNADKRVKRDDDGHADYLLAKMDNRSPASDGELNDLLSVMQIISCGSNGDCLKPEMYSMMDAYIRKVHSDENAGLDVPEEAKAKMSEFIDILQNEKIQEEKNIVPAHLLPLVKARAEVESLPKDPPSDQLDDDDKRDDPPLHSTIRAGQNRLLCESNEPEINPTRTFQGNHCEARNSLKDPGDSPKEPVFDTTGELVRNLMERSSPDSSRGQLAKMFVKAVNLLGGGDDPSSLRKNTTRTELHCLELEDSSSREIRPRSPSRELSEEINKMGEDCPNSLVSASPSEHTKFPITDGISEFNRTRNFVDAADATVPGNQIERLATSSPSNVEGNSAASDKDRDPEPKTSSTTPGVIYYSIGSSSSVVQEEKEDSVVSTSVRVKVLDDNQDPLPQKSADLDLQEQEDSAVPKYDSPQNPALRDYADSYVVSKSLPVDSRRYSSPLSRPDRLVGPSPPPRPEALFALSPRPLPEEIFASSPRPLPEGLFTPSPPPRPEGQFAPSPRPRPEELFVPSLRPRLEATAVTSPPLPKLRAAHIQSPPPRPEAVLVSSPLQKLETVQVVSPHPLNIPSLQSENIAVVVDNQKTIDISAQPEKTQVTRYRLNAPTQEHEEQPLSQTEYIEVLNDDSELAQNSVTAQIEIKDPVPQEQADYGASLPVDIEVFVNDGQNPAGQEEPDSVASISVCSGVLDVVQGLAEQEQPDFVGIEVFVNDGQDTAGREEPGSVPSTSVGSGILDDGQGPAKQEQSNFHASKSVDVAVMVGGQAAVPQEHGSMSVGIEAVHGGQDLTLQQEEVYVASNSWLIETLKDCEDPVSHGVTHFCAASESVDIQALEDCKHADAVPQGLGMFFSASKSVDFRVLNDRNDPATQEQAGYDITSKSMDFEESNDRECPFPPKIIHGIQALEDCKDANANTQELKKYFSASKSVDFGVLDGRNDPATQVQARYDITSKSIDFSELNRHYPFPPKVIRESETVSGVSGEEKVNPLVSKITFAEVMTDDHDLVEETEKKEVLDGNLGPALQGKEDPIASSEYMQRLATMMFLTEEPSWDDVKKLSQIVCFTFLSANGRDPPAEIVSKIFLEARHLNLALDVADRLLHLVHNLYEADGIKDIEMAPSDELVAFKVRKQDSRGRDMSDTSERAVLDFVRDLVEVGERDPYLVVKRDVDELDICFTTSNDGGEAIEVDLRDGFVDKEFKVAGSGEEPWWEVAARLSGKEISKSDSLHSSSLAQTSTVDKDGDTDNDNSTRSGYRTASRSEIKAAARFPGAIPIHESSHDDDIKDYWQNRERGLAKRFGYPAKTIEDQGGAKLGLEQPSFEETPARSYPSRSTIVPTGETIEDIWIQKRSMAMWTKNGSRELWKGNKTKETVVYVSEPRRINAVAATARLFLSGPFQRHSQDTPRLQQPWKRTYTQRTEGHSGFLGVHVYSLFDAVFPPYDEHPLDKKPWEHRVVKQRFLHEQSVSFCRNWFGILRPHRGNTVVEQPVIRVESMPMPVKAAEWTEEWYQTPFYRPLDTSRSVSTRSHARSTAPFANHPVGPYSNPMLDDDDDSALFDVPECGRIRNTRLKIGERISRVTPDLTSSLRRSRWRKKHFPRGTFPY